MRQNHGTTGVWSWAGRPLAVLLCLLLGLPLAACAMPGRVTWPTGTGQAAAITRLTEATAVPAAASGDLRLWWPPPRSLNPLSAETAAEKAVYDLVYEGLCRIEADDSVSWQLAENLLVFTGGRQVLVALDQDVAFHDGSPVTAGDVAQVMTYILDPANLSPWREGLEHVVGVRALNDQVLEILLAEPDPWLAWALTFPVIPADHLAVPPFTPIPGTGPYAIQRFDPDQGLTLIRQETAAGEAGLSQIQVKSYADQREAMKALERDELDLVLLDGQALPLYTVRTSLRLDRYAGQELIMFLCQDQGKRPLNDPALRTRVKQEIEAWSASPALPAWIAAGTLGFAAGSYLTRSDVQPASPGSILAGLTAADPAEVKPLQLIVPVQDARRVDLANEAASALEAAGLACEVTPLEPEPFWQALQEGRYDLALLAAVLPDKPCPGLLIRPERPASFADLDSLATAQGGLADYETWRDRFLALAAAPQRDYSRAEQLAQDWQEALNETMARSNWSIVGFSCHGLAYGSRVLGQLRPNRYHPYDGIKELWIWSSPSSSSY